MEISPLAYFLITLCWLSTVVLLLFWLYTRKPKERKPVPVDVLEAADAALRLRVVDLEDKFEHYVKRENVRGARARKEEAVEEQQGVLPLTKEELARRWAAQRGGHRGIVG